MLVNVRTSPERFQASQNMTTFSPSSKLRLAYKKGQFKRHRVDDLQFVEEQKKSAERIGEIASFLFEGKFCWTCGS